MKGAKTGGRKPGSLNKATSELKDLARVHTEAAVLELARLASGAQSEQARVAAIKELLDRGHGKATQLIDAGADLVQALAAIKVTFGT
jgi:hypothetical protein